MKKHTLAYTAATDWVPEYQYIADNDLRNLMIGLQNNKYRGNPPWEKAIATPKTIPNKGKFWHALDLFVIHELPGLSSMHPSEAEVIAHLQTNAGRTSMAETVGLCLEIDTSYGEKIIGLLNDETSILYRGLHSHRFNLLSKNEPTTMAFIRSECERARITPALNHRK